jgi:hypothetical protein
MRRRKRQRSGVGGRGKHAPTPALPRAQSRAREGVRKMPLCFWSPPLRVSRAEGRGKKDPAVFLVPSLARLRAGEG